MTAFNRIEDVDAFCLRLYSGDKQATLKVTSEGWRHIIDEIGLRLLLSVLQQSTSAYSIMFVSRAACECLETIFSDANELTQFTLSVYELLCVRDTELNAAAKLALRQLVCVAVQRGYRYSPTLAQMATTVCTSCFSSLSNEAARGRLHVGCEVLTDLVATLNERRMSTFASDVGIAKSFRDDHLLSVYRLSVEVLKQTNPTNRSAVAAALRLARCVLDFDFTCDASPAESEDSPVTRTYPESWAPFLVDVRLVDRLWCLYRIPDWEPEMAQNVLEVLTALVSLRKSTFTEPTLRHEWYAVMLLQTHLVMERYTHLEEAETLSVFARLLNRTKPNADLSELMQQDVFPRWVQSLDAFTKQCFANWRHASTSLLSLLSTWARLVEARSYATQDTSLLARAGLNVIAGYVACVHSRVRVFTEELGKFMSGDSPAAIVISTGSSSRSASTSNVNGAAVRNGSASNGGAASPRMSPPLHTSSVEYMLDDDTEGIRLEMVFVSKLVTGCGVEAWAQLEANAELVGQELATQLHRAPLTLSADVVVAIEEGAWSFHLLSAALLSDSAVDAGAPYMLAMLLHSFVQLKRFTAGAACLEGLPSSVRGHFVSGAILALSTVLAKTVSVYVQSNRKTTAFVEQLNTRLRQCEEMDPAGSFGVYFLDLAVYTLWTALNSTNIPGEVRMEALILLDEWSSTPSILRVLKETPSYRYVMNLYDDAFPMPLRHADSLAARSLFVRCVAQVRFFDSAALTDSVVGELVQPLLARVSAALFPTTSETTPSSAGEHEARLAFALCDIRGVLSCTERRPFRIITDVLEASLYPLADAVLRSDHVNEVAVLQLLEFVNELSSNKSQRIVYGPHSARPMLIFRYVSHVIVHASQLAHRALESSSTQLHPDGESPLTQWGWKVMRLSLTAAHNALQGGWCNLGVLQLYRDPALTEMLDTIWQLLCGLPSQEFTVRPKVCAAVVKIVNALAARFFHWFWMKQPAGHVSSVVGFVEALAFPTSYSAVDDGQQTAALQTIDRLINCCWVRTRYPSDEAQQAADMKSLLLRADPLIFHRIATCAIERSVAADNHAVHKLLPALCFIEGDALAEVAQYFAGRGTTPAAVQTLHLQFSDIQRQLAGTPDITSESINELQNSLHTLMDTLKVSL